MQRVLGKDLFVEDAQALIIAGINLKKLNVCKALDSIWKALWKLYAVAAFYSGIGAELYVRA